MAIETSMLTHVLFEIEGLEFGAIAIKSIHECVQKKLSPTYS